MVLSMLTAVLSRALILVCAYLYPAYQCFKVVEKSKVDAAVLRHWCKYWIIIAALSVLERTADSVLRLIPLYREAKLAFVIFLWHPQSQGTTYVYDTFVRPLVTKYEPEVDKSLAVLKAKAGDIGTKVTTICHEYAQEMMTEITKLANNNGQQQQQHPSRQAAQVHPEDEYDLVDRTDAHGAATTAGSPSAWSLFRRRQ